MPSVKTFILPSKCTTDSQFTTVYQSEVIAVKLHFTSTSCWAFTAVVTTSDFIARIRYQQQCGNISAGYPLKMHRSTLHPFLWHLNCLITIRLPMFCLCLQIPSSVNQPFAWPTHPPSVHRMRWYSNSSGFLSIRSCPSSSTASRRKKRRDGASSSWTVEVDESIPCLL